MIKLLLLISILGLIVPSGIVASYYLKKYLSFRIQLLIDKEKQRQLEISQNYFDN